MEQRKEISKKNFVRVCYTFLIIGTLTFSIFAWLSNFLIQSNAYYIEFMSLGFILLGIGIGLSCARIWKVKEIDQQ